MKWLEDELELNALHNPGSRRVSGNEKAAVSQRTALSAALGGRVDVGAMSTISGVVNLHFMVDIPLFSMFTNFVCDNTLLFGLYLMELFINCGLYHSFFGGFVFLVGSFDLMPFCLF